MIFLLLFITGFGQCFAAMASLDVIYFALGISNFLFAAVGLTLFLLTAPAFMAMGVALWNAYWIPYLTSIFFSLFSIYLASFLAKVASSQPLNLFCSH